MGLSENISKRISFLQNVCEKKAESLKHVPEGTIYVRQRKNSSVWRFKAKGEKGNGAYLSKKQTQLARQLAQKQYDQQVLRYGQEELKILTKLNQFYAGTCIDKIYGNYSEARQSLVVPVIPSDKQFIDQFLSAQASPLPFMPNDQIYKTVRGEMMRSKSEVIISDRLANAGIVYIYEPVLTIGNEIKRPDFGCLNLRLRRIIYWEHFGMMDDPDYAEKAVAKLTQYAKNGYILGYNLIITMETRQHPLDTDIVQKMIDTYLK